MRWVGFTFFCIIYSFPLHFYFFSNRLSQGMNRQTNVDITTTLGRGEDSILSEDCMCIYSFLFWASTSNKWFVSNGTISSPFMLCMRYTYRGLEITWGNQVWHWRLPSLYTSASDLYYLSGVHIRGVDTQQVAGTLVLVFGEELLSYYNEGDILIDYTVKLNCV